MSRLVTDRCDEFIVVDDFYKDPWGVRALAEKAEYAPSGTLSKNVAGIESCQNYFSQRLVEKFEGLCGRPIQVDTSRNAFGRFRLGLTKDCRRTRVHYDNTDWTAVIFLTPTSYSRGGTHFFRHRETGLISPPNGEQLRNLNMTIQQFDSEIVMRDTLDESKWEVTKVCPMKFNRCLLLRGSKFFHGSDQLFGESFADGRLTQNFFFNEIR